jgi:RNA recognition motif-containing protein
MKEGRMKNQAFITFSNLEWASIALEEVHGYLLKDRPIILVSSFFWLF